MRVFRRVIPNPHAPQLAQYQRRSLPDAGAAQFVYLKPVAWPLYTLWGNGILTLQQFNIVQPNQLRSKLALTKAPIWGGGVPAGSIDLQGLVDESANASNSNA